MSCAIFTGLGVFAAFANKNNSWIVEASFAAALVCLVIACFLAWRDERKLLIAERGRNQKPELHGEIDQVFIGNVLEADAQTPVPGAVILVVVKAWNIVQMPEFSVHKYALEVTIDTPSGLSTFVGTQGEWAVNMKVGDSFSLKHMMRDRLRQMRYIDPQQGAVGFYVKELSPDTIGFKSIVLNLIDATNSKHPVALSEGKFVHNVILSQRIQNL
jgi:hypothetical protein